MLAHQTRTVVGFTTRAKKKTNRSWSSASASAKKIPMLSATNAERFVRSEGFGYAVMKSRIVSICSATTRARAGLGTDLGQRNMPLLRRTHARAHARTRARAQTAQPLSTHSNIRVSRCCADRRDGRPTEGGDQD